MEDGGKRGMMRRTGTTLSACSRWTLISILSLALLAAGTSSAARAAGEAGDVALKEESARWESGYGVKFFQVVGSVTNQGRSPLGAVQVRVELLDGAGKVVKQADAWNAAAEQLADATGEAAKAKLAGIKAKAVAPGGSDRFRASFLEEETPKFERHRVRVLATLPAP